MNPRKRSEHVPLGRRDVLTPPIVFRAPYLSVQPDPHASREAGNHRLSRASAIFLLLLVRLPGTEEPTIHCPRAAVPLLLVFVYLFFLLENTKKGVV